MRVRDCNWMMIEESLKHDDRAVVPIGCTEQHAYLSLAVDAILAENVAVDAAEPLGVPVFPVIPFGHTPTFMAYPGTVSLRLNQAAATQLRLRRHKDGVAGVGNACEDGGAPAWSRNVERGNAMGDQ